MASPDTLDLTLAQNWTPKTLSTAVINTLTAKKARDVGEILSITNVELNDFFIAKGEIKQITFTTLVEHICTNHLLRERTEDELITILSAFYIRLYLEIMQARTQNAKRGVCGKEAKLYEEFQAAREEIAGQQKKAA